LRAGRVLCNLAHVNPGRTYGLSIALLVMFVTLPLLDDDTRFLSSVVFIGVFLTGLYVITEHRRQWVVGMSLVAPAILLALYELVVVDQSADAKQAGNIIESLTFAAYSVALALLVFAMFRRLLTAKRATPDTLSAAASGYVLIGVLWACIFAILLEIDPGCIRGLDAADRPGDVFYFSFVTMTTLGYGDIAPITPVARVCVALEAVVSQLYIAIAIARLVGLHIAAGVSSDVSSS